MGVLRQYFKDASVKTSGKPSRLRASWVRERWAERAATYFNHHTDEAAPAAARHLECGKAVIWRTKRAVQLSPPSDFHHASGVKAPWRQAQVT